VSEEKRRASDAKLDEMAESLTRVTTMLEINFHPETGHFTKGFEELKTKVESHDIDIKRAKWTLSLLGMIGLGTVRSWLKQAGFIH
jgi:hypothetical protein